MKIEPFFQAYRSCLETLTADTIDNLDAHLVEDVRFQDPFHNTTGKAAMKRAIARVFDTATDVSFCVNDHAAAVDRIFFKWRLSAKLREKTWRVNGVTVVVFSDMGQVVSHEEYWDAASQLYELFPLIGPLLRLLRRRVART
jgi:hypothetical protein